MSRLSPLAKLGAGALVVVVCGSVAWWARQPASIDATSSQNVLDIQGILEERARSESRPAGQRTAALVRETISRERATLMFGNIRDSNPFNEFDPQAIFRSPAGLDQRVVFAEHPDGFVRIRTNSLGLRRVSELSSSRPDLRVLVLGDSHTEGPCQFDETYSARLERYLAEEAPARSVEVLNAGKSGYSFYNYVGALEHFASLDPHVVVCTVYSGNDFVEALLLHHYFQRTRPGVSWTELTARPSNSPNCAPRVLSQSHQQLVCLSRFPAEYDVALEAGVLVTASMADFCRERSIRFLCVLLPPMADTQPQWFEPDLEALCSALELDAHARQVTERLSDAWVERVSSVNVELLDLRPIFRSASIPLYWRRDHHLNLDGQRVVAQAIHAALRADHR